jgi:hypothetical protein
MTHNLTDQDRADLARFLCEAIEADRFPLSPGVRRLKERAPEKRARFNRDLPRCQRASVLHPVAAQPVSGDSCVERDGSLWV